MLRGVMFKGLKLSWQLGLLVALLLELMVASALERIEREHAKFEIFGAEVFKLFMQLKNS
jgi:hypothetical protein